MAEPIVAPDMSLLLVEDHPVMAATVTAALRRRGYDAEHCATLAEARERIARKVPRYAVLDLRLPDGSGLGMVNALRQASLDISIVVLTGFANIPTAIEAIKLGANNYLCKPVDIETLDGALQGRSLNEELLLEEPPASVPDVQQEYIQRILEEHRSNISATARALGMHRRTLQRRLLRSGDAN